MKSTNNTLYAFATAAAMALSLSSCRDTKPGNDSPDMDMDATDSTAVDADTVMGP